MSEDSDRPGIKRYSGMSPQEMETEQERRRSRALDMRVRGLTYKQIGEQLGIGTSASHSLVTREMQRMREETAERAEQLRQIAHARFEAMVRRLWLKAMPANPDDPLDYEAIAKLVSVVEKDSKIMGYSAPNKHQVDISHLQSQIGHVIEVIARVLPDDQIPKIYEAVEQAMTVINTRALSLEG